MKELFQHIISLFKQQKLDLVPIKVAKQKKKPFPPVSR